MDPVSRWTEIIEKTVRKEARNFPPEQREDIKQDCWLAVVESQTNIEAFISEHGDVEARGYVMRICRNVVVDAVKKSGRQFETSPLDNDTAHTEDKKDSNPFGVSKAELIDALDHLTRDQRFVIDCVFFRRMTEDQIGLDVKKSQQWVSKEKTAAILALRGLLKGKDAGKS